MKALICGGRNFHRGDRVNEVLDALHAERPISCVITGAAPGADLCGEDWARARSIPYRGYPARWKEHADGWCACGPLVHGPRARRGELPANCPAAGPRRNAWMLECEHRPGKLIALVVAFPGGAGTAGMVELARKAGIAVQLVAS